MNVKLHSSPYGKRPLGEVADVISGFAFKSTDFGDKGIPVIKIKNIRLGHVDLNEASYVDEKHLNIELLKLIPESGDTPQCNNQSVTIFLIIYLYIYNIYLCLEE